MQEWRWKNQYIDKLEELREYIISADAEGNAPACQQAILLKAKSFEKTYCEIGSGSGQHLVQRAKLDPASLYIGIELRFKRCYKTAEKAAVQQLTNLLIIRGTATQISLFFPAAFLHGIYVNFPDPWDKRRWKKHRLLNDKYLMEINALLLAGGFFSYKTDHQEYFNEICQFLKNSKIFTITKISNNLHQEATAAKLVLSEFEMLFKSKNLAVHYLEAFKP